MTEGHFGPSTITIQPMPNLSVSIPYRGDQNVLSSGMVTWPPALSAANALSAAASVFTERQSENPLKCEFASHPSEAMIVVCPTRNAECMTLFSNPGASLPGGGGA